MNSGPESQAVTATDPSNRIYIGNLVYSAKIKDIAQLLSQYSLQFTDIDMSVDPFTARNPSYCFVDFSSSEDAQEALARLQGTQLLGRALKVGPCKAKTRDREDNRIFNRYTQASDAEEHWERAVFEQRRVHVFGLTKPKNQLQSERVIVGIFEGFQVEAISKVISPPVNPYSKRCRRYRAFVDLASKEEATRAVRALDGIDFKGEPLGVSIARNTMFTKIYERELMDGPKDMEVAMKPERASLKSIERPEARRDRSEHLRGLENWRSSSVAQSLLS